MDELDALFSAPQVKQENTSASSAAPAASLASAPAAAAAPASAAPASAAASSSAAMVDDSDDEEDDDDDVGINLVLDAPSSTPVRGAGGAFGTPISLKTNRFSKWGAPLNTPQQGAAPSTPAAAATPVAAAAPAATVVSTVQYVSSTAPGAAGAMPMGASSAAGSGAASRESSRPFRLPMPSEHIFEQGQSLDMRIERPWTQPGADPTDWFNYGFDEETWKLWCAKQIQMRINAKMKGKLNVYEGDDSGQQQRIQQRTGATAPRPPMPQTVMLPSQTQMQMQARPAMASQGRPFAQGGQQISSYDGDDATVQLGGRGAAGGGAQRFQQAPMAMPMQMQMPPQFAGGAARPFPTQPNPHAPPAAGQYGQQPLKREM